MLQVSFLLVIFGIGTTLIPQVPSEHQSQPRAQIVNSISGYVWCRYKSGGKTLIETQCSYSLQPSSACQNSPLSESYILSFSNKSKAHITSSCDESNIQVNGMKAEIEYIALLGRVYKSIKIGSDEIIEFEDYENPPLSADMPNKPLWSEEWKMYGEPGLCYEPPSELSTAAGCVRNELCISGGWDVEQSCTIKFISEEKVLYIYGVTEEYYETEGRTFSGSDIDEINNSKCFPTAGRRKFCFRSTGTIDEDTHISPRNNQIAGKSEYEGEFFKGKVVFGEDNTSFINFMESNLMEMVYFEIDIGHDINTSEAIHLSETCKYNSSDGSVSEHLARTDVGLLIALSKSANGSIECGDVLEIDLSKAAIGVPGEGTGYYMLPIRGIFQISRIGRWNDLQRIYRMRGVDASYEVLRSAKDKAHSAQ